MDLLGFFRLLPRRYWGQPLFMQPTQRPWLSLWVTIHFVVLALCLLGNIGTSQLLTRLSRAVAPYAISLHQDYGRLPLGMTTGQEIDKPCRFEIHPLGQADDQWQPLPVGNQNWLGLADHRAGNFARMLAVAGEDKHEEILGLLFDQVVEQCLADGQQIDAVRLRRLPAASYEQAVLLSTGELPAGALQELTIFECKVIELPGGLRRLLPVLDKVRRAHSAGASN